MKTNTKVSILFLAFTIALTTHELLAQSNGANQNNKQHAVPSMPGMAKPGTKVGGGWTLLSDKDDLVFETKKGKCGQQNMLMMKVQNKSAKEVHVFVSLSLQDGMHTPQQVLILKANQTIEIGCRPNAGFMPMYLRHDQEPTVSLEYNINTLLKK